MTIVNPHFLLLLLGLIPLWALYLISYVQGVASLKKLGYSAYKKEILSVYSKKNYFSLSFLSIGYIFLVLAIADFRWEKEYVVKQASGVDVVFVVDVSNSMMANDISPNRLDRVKRVLSLLIDEENHCRYSLVAFKGAAVQQIPMTEDVGIFYSWLNALSPSMITVSGTDIADGVSKGIDSFTEGKETRKIIYLFTDGGDKENASFYDLYQLLDKEKIKLIPVACGTEEGGLIVLEEGRVMKSKEDKVINLPVNNEFLNQIATTLNVPLYSLQDAGVVNDLQKILKSEIQWIGVNDYSVLMASEQSIFLLISFFAFMLFVWIRALKFRGVF